MIWEKEKDKEETKCQGNHSSEAGQQAAEYLQSPRKTSPPIPIHRKTGPNLSSVVVLDRNHHHHHHNNNNKIKNSNHDQDDNDFLLQLEAKQQRYYYDVATWRLYHRIIEHRAKHAPHHRLTTSDRYYRHIATPTTHHPTATTNITNSSSSPGYFANNSGSATVADESGWMQEVFPMEL